ncbi:hypothetical protein HanLR1_Chr06g0197791 [Helianthus annuus]|nr:hypothetical protein HanLR1_Chr06g0197791 [Helianthus annuus]
MVVAFCQDFPKGTLEMALQKLISVCLSIIVTSCVYKSVSSSGSVYKPVWTANSRTLISNC